MNNIQTDVLDDVKQLRHSLVQLNIKEFYHVVSKLGDFFKAREFTKAGSKNLHNVLVAFEDTNVMLEFYNAGDERNLAPTGNIDEIGQMWLENELLKHPEAKGYYHITTAVRTQDQDEDVNNNIFPLFEFEMRGGVDALIELEKALLTHLGYDTTKFNQSTYADMAANYNVDTLDNDNKKTMASDISSTIFLTDFPDRTDPFWNMKRHDTPNQDMTKQVNVIMNGKDTFVSAQRDTDPVVMRERFNTMSQGNYKEKIFERFGNGLHGLFGQESIEKDIDDFFNLNMIERSGGSIDIMRLISSMKVEGLMPEFV